MSTVLRFGLIGLGEIACQIDRERETQSAARAGAARPLPV